MGWVASSLLMMPLASLAILASIPPLIVLLRSKNFAASTLIISILILNISNLANATIWHSFDVSTWWDGKIFCDIEVKLNIGSTQAIDGALASIFWQISAILHPDHPTVAPSPEHRKTTLVIETVLCIVLPVYVMIGHYMIQEDRYRVRASEGCLATFYPNYAAPFLTYMWPMLVCIFAGVHSIISVIRLYHHRKQMSAVLSHTPGATSSRFFRLFIIAFVLLAIYLPLAIYTFVKNVQIPMQPFQWSYTHPPDWSDRIYFMLYPKSDFQNITFDRWAQVLAGYLSFIFFGLGQDANQMYRSWIASLRRFLRPESARRGASLQQPSRRLISSSTHGGVAIEMEHNQLSLPHNSISELSA